MELSKVVDGFIDSDTLIIKAQVQVIRFIMLFPLYSFVFPLMNKRGIYLCRSFTLFSL